MDARSLDIWTNEQRQRRTEALHRMKALSVGGMVKDSWQIH